MNPIYFLSCERQIRCLFSLAGHSSDIDTVLIDISKNLWNLLGNESLLKTRGGIPFGPLALSVLKTLDNWLFSTSALALGSVNTSFPTLRSWTSVPSFLSFLMWPENLGVLVYGVVEKIRKITVSGPINVLGMCNCFLANLNSFQSDCLSDFFALLCNLCFFLVCLLKLRRNQGSLWHEVLVRYAGIHYASKPLLKHVPLCIHGFVLPYFEVSCKFL